MKITSLLFGCMMLMGAFTAKATDGVFYVTSGEAFQLKPKSTFYGYKWLVGGVEVLAGEIAGDGSITKTFTLTNALSAETKTISFAVLDGLNGCFSDLTTNTIIVLPKLTVAVTALVDDFCTNATTISADATASIVEVVGALTTGVGISNTYQWFKDGVLIPGATTATYTITEVGSYTALTTYTLPTNTGSKLGTAITSAAGKIIKKTKAIPTAPLLDVL